jgi:hypothetical protein
LPGSRGGRGDVLGIAIDGLLGHGRAVVPLLLVAPAAERPPALRRRSLGYDKESQRQRRQAKHNTAKKSSE